MGIMEQTTRVVEVGLARMVTVQIQANTTGPTVDLNLTGNGTSGQFAKCSMANSSFS